MMASSPASSRASSVSPRLRRYYLSSSSSAHLAKSASIHSPSERSSASAGRDYSGLDSPNNNPISSSSKTARRIPSPIPIPTPRRNPNEIPTPVSGRGQRQRHCFPFGGASLHREPSPLRVAGLSDDNDLTVPLSPIRHMSINSNMHGERGTSYYTPTSPLSPNMHASARPISPQPARPRSNFSPKSSNSMRLGNLPRFHPAVYQSPNHAPEPTSNPRAPTSPLLKPSSAHSRTSTDSPRLMRQFQRELLARADISSRIAASPYTTKPTAPHIDPADSPGPVTPLELEDAGDYFMVAGGGRGPAESPGARSEGSVKDAGTKANTAKAGSTKKGSPRR